MPRLRFVQSYSIHGQLIDTSVIWMACGWKQPHCARARAELEAILTRRRHHNRVVARTAPNGKRHEMTHKSHTSNKKSKDFAALIKRIKARPSSYSRPT